MGSLRNPGGVAHNSPGCQPRVMRKKQVRALKGRHMPPPEDGERPLPSIVPTRRGGI